MGHGVGSDDPSEFMSKPKLPFAGATLQALEFGPEQTAEMIAENMKKFKNFSENFEARRSRVHAHLDDDIPEVDWRDILRHLDLHTPPRSANFHDNALRVKVRRAAAAELLYGPDTNIYAITQRTGCYIESTVELAERDNYVGFLLSGPVTAIAKAAAEISRIAPHSRPDGFSVADPLKFNTDASKLDGYRLVRSDEWKEMRRPKHVRDVPRPDQWTQVSLAKYVQHVTAIEAQGHWIQKLYNKSLTADHNVVDSHGEVMKLFEELWQEKEVWEVMTAEAANYAIEWYINTGQKKAVHFVLSSLHRHNIRQTTETYNIMLRYFAKTRNMKRFHWWLDIMRRRGYRPDVYSWIAFIRTIDDPEIKELILKVLQGKRVLYQTKVRRELADSFCEMEMSRHLANGKSLKDFFAHMDKRWERDWMTTPGAGFCIRVLARHGLISLCCDFTAEMSRRNVKVDNWALRMIITCCKYQNNAEGALKALDIISRQHQLKWEAKTYQSIFELALATRKPNLLGAVWRNACLDGFVTHKMKVRVKEHLDTVVGLKRNTDFRSPMESLMGAMCIGSVKPKSSIRASDYTTSESTPDNALVQVSQAPLVPQVPTLEMTAWDLDSKQTRHRFTYCAVDRCANIFEEWSPVRPMIDVLLDAYAIDKSWEAQMMEHNVQNALAETLNDPDSMSTFSPEEEPSSNLEDLLKEYDDAHRKSPSESESKDAWVGQMLMASDDSAEDPPQIGDEGDDALSTGESVRRARPAADSKETSGSEEAGAGGYRETSDVSDLVAASDDAPQEDENGLVVIAPLNDTSDTTTQTQLWPYNEEEYDIVTKHQLSSEWLSGMRTMPVPVTPRQRFDADGNPIDPNAEFYWV